MPDKRDTGADVVDAVLVFGVEVFELGAIGLLLPPHDTRHSASPPEATAARGVIVASGCTIAAVYDVGV